jgi:DNA helicase-2/ATP-dependent DNA helicase PcrA
MSLTDGKENDELQDPLLAGLTKPQQEAVCHTEGPLLILAAAGSGKTRTLTRRIGYLVQQGIPPWSILALTFTNKAAAEMRERVHAILGDRAGRGLTVTTFHSLCARLLRRYAEPAGLKPDFSIYDTSDQVALMKKVLESLQLSGSNWPPRSVLGAISNAKNDLMDAAAYTAHALDFYAKTIAKAYTGFERALRASNAVDFDDLLLLTAKMLKDNERVRGECQRRWQYLLIDEYQDTNHAQFVIASMIAGTGKERASGAGPNICVVGDPDQCLPKGTLIATPKGPKPVETLRDGDLVLSAVGWGRHHPMAIDKAMSRPYKGDLLRIAMEDGSEIRATPNHVVFARLRVDASLHYTYLMWKKGVGFRLGTTRGVRASKDGEIVSGLQVRTNQEVADAIWIVHAGPSSAEARYFEHFYSVKYGIPTMVFFARGRKTPSWVCRT